MLKEYLLNEAPRQAVWSGSMPGMQICRFTLPDRPQAGVREIPVQGTTLHFEAIFCLRGRLTIKPLWGESYVVEAPGIFLLSDITGLSACLCSGDLCGILIAVDATAAKESLMTLCSLLGMKVDTRIVNEKMASGNGCMALSDIPWTQALFETLRRLPEAERDRYCVFKTVELLYLLCSEHSLAAKTKPGPDGYASPLMREIRAYLYNHLSEKNTIQVLCRQFSISPTFLKEGFRRAYGTPIHSFLIRLRLLRAKELICTTRMPIQQIAQAVGYEGMSQFNASFKRHYEMTPGQYRKMSETATLCPF